MESSCSKGTQCNVRLGHLLEGAGDYSGAGYGGYGSGYSHGYGHGVGYCQVEPGGMLDEPSDEALCYLSQLWVQLVEWQQQIMQHPLDPLHSS